MEATKGAQVQAQASQAQANSGQCLEQVQMDNVFAEQVTAGLFGISIAEARKRIQEQKAKREAQRPRLLRQYGFEDLSDSDIRAILQAEEQLAKCARCDGTICLLKSAYLMPVIRKGYMDNVNIAAARCEFGERRIVFNRCRKLVKIPRKFLGKGIDDYEITDDNADAAAIAEWFITENPECGIYYYGGCGTGKTYLAAIIAQAHIRRGKSAVFGDVPSLLDELKATFDDKDKSAQDLMSKFATCDLLVLDDIGTGKINEWNVGVLYQIINERYISGKPLVITSNYSLSELEKRLIVGDKFSARRIISRIEELCEVACLGEHDRRRRV